MTFKLHPLVAIVPMLAVLTISTATASTTDQTMQTPYDFRHMSFGDQYAQAGAMANLRPSTVRRLQYYSDKVMASLMVLVNEDNQAGQDGASVNSATTTALRTSIERLIGAGEKAELTLEQTADFFTQEATVQFTSDVPTILMDAQGNLDAYVLFQGVAMNPMQGTPTDSAAAVDYLNMVTSAGVVAQGSDDGTTPAAPTVRVVEATSEPEPKIVRAPAVQAYWDRLVEVDGKQTIIVRSGDTLASYAANFYQDSLQYRRIFNANTAQLRSPSFLEVGQVIIIPDV